MVKEWVLAAVAQWYSALNCGSNDTTSILALAIDLFSVFLENFLSFLVGSGFGYRTLLIKDLWPCPQR